MWYKQHQIAVPSPGAINSKLQTSQSDEKLKCEYKETTHLHLQYTTKTQKRFRATNYRLGAN